MAHSTEVLNRPDPTAFQGNSPLNAGDFAADVPRGLPFTEVSTVPVGSEELATNGPAAAPAPEVDPNTMDDETFQAYLNGKYGAPTYREPNAADTRPTDSAYQAEVERQLELTAALRDRQFTAAAVLASKSGSASERADFSQQIQAAREAAGLPPEFAMPEQIDPTKGTVYRSENALGAEPQLSPPEAKPKRNPYAAPELPPVTLQAAETPSQPGWLRQHLTSVMSWAQGARQEVARAVQDVRELPQGIANAAKNAQSPQRLTAAVTELVRGLPRLEEVQRVKTATRDFAGHIASQPNVQAVLGREMSGLGEAVIQGNPLELRARLRRVGLAAAIAGAAAILLTQTKSESK